MGSHNDAMCGGVWYLLVLHMVRGIFQLGSHLVRKVSHWYDVSFLVDFSSSFPFLFLFSVCQRRIIEKLNVQCCTTCPKH